MNPATVIPTYNEATNGELMTEGLLELDLSSMDVLIVDDDSPDGTGSITDRLAVQHHAHGDLLDRTDRRGSGGASIDGLRRATAPAVGAVIQMDCDLSPSPNDVRRQLAQLAIHGVVVCASQVEGDPTDEFEDRRIGNPR